MCGETGGWQEGDTINESSSPSNAFSVYTATEERNTEEARNFYDSNKGLEDME